MQNFWLDKEKEERLPIFDVNDMFASADKLFVDIPYEELEEGGCRSAMVFITEPVLAVCGSMCGKVEVVDKLFHKMELKSRHICIKQTAKSKLQIIKDSRVACETQ